MMVNLLPLHFMLITLPYLLMQTTSIQSNLNLPPNSILVILVNCTSLLESIFPVIMPTILSQFLRSYTFWIFSHEPVCWIVILLLPLCHPNRPWRSLMGHDLTSHI